MISIFPPFISRPIYELKEGDFVRFGRNRAGIAIPYQQYGSAQKQIYLFDLNASELIDLGAIQTGNPYVLIFPNQYTVEIGSNAVFSNDIYAITGGELIAVNHGQNTEYAIATNPSGKEELVAFTFSGQKIRLHQGYTTLIDEWSICVEHDKNTRVCLYRRSNAAP